MTDPDGYVTQYGYDGNDRLTSVSQTVDGKTARTGYTYQNDRLASITHSGFSYHFVYDQWGNPSETRVGNQTLSKETLLPHDGPVSEKTYGNGDKVSFAYNKDEAVTQVSYDGKAAFRYQYDSYGNSVRKEDLLNGVRYFYSYDFLGRPVSVRSTHGQAFENSYDAKNRLDQVVSEVDGQTTTTGYTYGNADKGEMADAVYAVKVDGTGRLSYTYDKYGRMASRKLALTAPYTQGYTYLKAPSGGDTFFVSSVSDGKDTYDYTYDAHGNITTIKENGKEKLRYTYDALDELTRVDDAYEGKSHTYAYDTGGNLTSHSVYAYTTGELGEAEETISYGYGDANWKDKLTAYDGQSITYDAIGNPLDYRDGMSFTWQHGRELATLTQDGKTTRYHYDGDGYRVKKERGGETTVYYRNGGSVLTEITGEERLDFFYDEQGLPFGFRLNGTAYYYRKNQQGDVTGILDGNGTQVAAYQYDAWGRPLSCTGSAAATVGEANPIRYRGYYYDAESGLYYLNSRYYDPEVGRFINADGYISTGQGLLSHNMFLYCENNPVNRRDSTGLFWEGIWEFLKNAISEIGKTINAWTPAYAGVGSVATVDGPLPAADVAAGVGIVGLTIGAIGYGTYKAATKPKQKAKEKEITVAPKAKKQIYFPKNPYDFKPKGLVETTHVKIGTGKNGGIIKWSLPGSHITIFEWNEDYIHGEHYHALKIEWDQKHYGPHYLPGSPVPEPWNTMYFGG